MIVSAQEARARARRQLAWARSHAKRAAAARRDAERSVQRVTALLSRMTARSEMLGTLKTAQR